MIHLCLALQSREGELTIPLHASQHYQHVSLQATHIQAGECFGNADTE